MRLYTGFDLHSSNSYVGIIDENGKRVFNRKLPNHPAVIVDILRPFRNDITDIAVESTYNWYWLVDLLMAEGYKVHLANPSAIQKYTGLQYSDDRHDAFWLAEMMRLGILPEGYILSKRGPTDPGSVAQAKSSGKAPDIAHHLPAEHRQPEQRHQAHSRRCEGYCIPDFLVRI